MDTEGGFIARVDRYLRDTNSGEAINHGVGGDTTTMMLERLGAVVDRMREKPSPLALVTLGINDVPRIVDDAPDKRVDIELHLSSLKRILAELDGIGGVLYLTQYPVDYDARSLDPELVGEYVTKGAQAARELGVGVIDIHSAITIGCFKQFIFEDGLHFNNRGHEFIANRVIAELHRSGRLSE